MSVPLNSWLLIVGLLVAGCLHENGDEPDDNAWKAVAGNCQHLGRMGEHSIYARFTFHPSRTDAPENLSGTTVTLSHRIGDPAEQTKVTDAAGCVGFQVEGEGRYWIGGMRYPSETNHSCFWHGGNYTDYDGSGAARVDPLMNLGCS